MSVARKDDRHNDDLVGEIADSFNRAVGEKRVKDGEPAAEKPRFVVTGDNRTQPRKNRGVR
ncbi:hypothetical protein [Amycolatopsis sp.]|jgi:hypothetical protein|uniref:hypothetical protein n=1 Tax=Amycolatopsis sp. TaxID=37632 RepID=UPI002DFE94AB|nr:hypothetical protein [Amycolatopsis sp.]